MSTTTNETETPSGLRRIVKLLADDGFEVVHADDGRDHAPNCKNCDHSLVIVWAPPDRLAVACMRVVILLGQHGIRFGEVDGGPWIHGSYDPIDDCAEVELHRLFDRMLPPEPN